jgi:hypothetical protein
MTPTLIERSKPVRSTVDAVTGRAVYQLTDHPSGVGLDYFRFPRHVPGGWVLVRVHDTYGFGLIHPDTGEFRRVPEIKHYLKLRPSDGRLWYLDGRSLYSIDLPEGTPKLLSVLPENLPAGVTDITCDGRTLILSKIEQDLVATPVPTDMSLEGIWKYLRRPRRSTTWTYDVETHRLRTLLETEGVGMFHHDTHPTDPTLLRYALDHWEGDDQRAYAIRIDGQEPREMAHQEPGELITHEWWWPDAMHMGYCYQDRRNDPKRQDIPWSEYSPAPTQIGACDLSGRVTYLSDPINCYHTHLYTSPDGRFVSGEGTDGHSFVYAAAFSFGETKVKMTAMATVHTPYVPFRGQLVNADFSADSRWLLFNDLVEGKYQVFAVGVDF